MGGFLNWELSHFLSVFIDRELILLVYIKAIMINTDIQDTLSSLHVSISMEEQYRRASLFKIACRNAGFSEKRVESICQWINDNPSGVGSIFKSWSNVLDELIDDDTEMEMWYDVALFLTEGGDIEAKPYELSLANSVCNHGIRECLERMYNL